MKILFLIFLLTACGGCAHTKPVELEETIVEITTYVFYECGEVPALTPVRLIEVHWILYRVGNNSVWTLTADQYENLGKNTSSILLGVKELKGQRDFWKACIDDSQARSPDGSP